VDLPIQRLILQLHLLERIHDGIAPRLSRLPLGGKLGLLALIARFTLGFALDETALLHRFGRRGTKRYGGACEEPCERKDESLYSNQNHPLLSWFGADADLR
jgi:hypothetical protein